MAAFFSFALGGWAERRETEERNLQFSQNFSTFMANFED
jgi:hypothetical protein